MTLLRTQVRTLTEQVATLKEQFEDRPGKPYRGYRRANASRPDHRQRGRNDDNHPRDTDNTDDGRGRVKPTGDEFEESFARPARSNA